MFGFNGKGNEKKETLVFLVILILCLGVFIATLLTIVKGGNTDSYHYGYSLFTFGATELLGILIFTGSISFIIIYGFVRKRFFRNDKGGLTKWEKAFIKDWRKHRK